MEEEEGEGVPIIHTIERSKRIRERARTMAKEAGPPQGCPFQQWDCKKEVPCIGCRRWKKQRPDIYPRMLDKCCKCLRQLIPTKTKDWETRRYHVDCWRAFGTPKGWEEQRMISLEIEFARDLETSENDKLIEKEARRLEKQNKREEEVKSKEQKKTTKKRKEREEEESSSAKKQHTIPSVAPVPVVIPAPAPIPAVVPAPISVPVPFPSPASIPALSYYEEREKYIVISYCERINGWCLRHSHNITSIESQQDLKRIVEDIRKTCC